MSAYLSKGEDQLSEALKQTAREVYESGKPVSERIRSISNNYRTHRETSAQEVVAIALPDIWLHKTCPGVTFANRILPEKIFRIYLFKWNMIHR